MPAETNGIGRIIIENLTVYFILIDILGQQFTDDKIDNGFIRIIDKTSCVSHHATINACSPLAIHLSKAIKLPDDSEYQFTRTTHMRMRNK